MVIYLWNQWLITHGTLNNLRFLLNVKSFSGFLMTGNARRWNVWCLRQLMNYNEIVVYYNNIVVFLDFCFVLMKTKSDISTNRSPSQLWESRYHQFMLTLILKITYKIHTTSFGWLLRLQTLWPFEQYIFNQAFFSKFNTFILHLQESAFSSRILHTARVDCLNSKSPTHPHHTHTLPLSPTFSNLPPHSSYN